MNNIKDLKILVAEDNGTFRKLLGAMIERITGTEPTTAEDGEEALSLASQDSYDLIFMDNHMPRLSGVEATQRIRQDIPESEQPHIVGISGSSSNHDLKQLEESGMNALLSKPFHMDELAGFIHEVSANKTSLLAVA